MDCDKEGRWSGPQQVYQEGPVQARVQTDTQMLGVGLFGYVGRWPTAAPPAGRGSQRLTMNIDMSVAVSEKSCFRQAPTRTGCAYGGALTRRCRGRHCALVTQCSGRFARFDISSDLHDCRDRAKKLLRASFTSTC